MNGLTRQYLLLLFTCAYCVSFVYKHDSHGITKADCDICKSDTQWTLYLNYLVTIALNVVIISLFIFNKDVSFWDVAKNIKQFNIFALGCILYETFCGILLWGYGSCFLNMFWGFKWIMEGFANIVPGLYFHDPNFTQFEPKKSLMSYVLFVVYFGKMVEYLLDPGLFRNEFLCRIGVMYDCISDDISYVQQFYVVITTQLALISFL